MLDWHTEDTQKRKETQDTMWTMAQNGQRTSSSRQREAQKLEEEREKKTTSENNNTDKTMEYKYNHFRPTSCHNLTLCSLLMCYDNGNNSKTICSSSRVRLKLTLLIALALAILMPGVAVIKRPSSDSFRFALFHVGVPHILMASGSLCPSRCTCDNQRLAVDCASMMMINSSSNDQLISGHHQVGHQPLGHVPLTLNPALRTLSLAGNSVRQLSSSLTIYRELEYLNLARNELVQVEQRNFAHLTRLTTLALSDNRIEHLGPSSSTTTGGGFDPTLDVSATNMEQNHHHHHRHHHHNHHRQDHDGNADDEHEPPFVHLKQLHNLYISGNRLTRLARHTFHGLMHLRHLDLSANQLNFIHPLAFAGLTALRSLSLRNNRLIGAQLPTWRLSLATPALVSLDLGQNPTLAAPTSTAGSIMGSLPPLAFANLNELRELYLDDCSLSQLHPQTFIATSADLSDVNGVNCEPKGTIVNDEQSITSEQQTQSGSSCSPSSGALHASPLRRLFLQSNNLRSTSTSDTWRPLSRLVELDLSDNPFDTHLGVGAFDNLIALRHLSLDRLANVRTINALAWRSLRNLTRLSIESCPQLTHIDFVWTGSDNIDPMLTNVILPALEWLSLRNNRLQRLTNNLAPWRQLRHLDLGGTNEWQCDCGAIWMQNLLSAYAESNSANFANSAPKFASNYPPLAPEEQQQQWPTAGATNSNEWPTRDNQLDEEPTALMGRKLTPNVSSGQRLNDDTVCHEPPVVRGRQVALVPIELMTCQQQSMIGIDQMTTTTTNQLYDQTKSSDIGNIEQRITGGNGYGLNLGSLTTDNNPSSVMMINGGSTATSTSTPTSINPSEAADVNQIVDYWRSRHRATLIDWPALPAIVSSSQSSPTSGSPQSSVVTMMRNELSTNLANSGGQKQPPEVVAVDGRADEASVIGNFVMMTLVGALLLVLIAALVSLIGARAQAARSTADATSSDTSTSTTTTTSGSSSADHAPDDYYHHHHHHRSLCSTRKASTNDEHTSKRQLCAHLKRDGRAVDSMMTASGHIETIQDEPSLTTTTIVGWPLNVDNQDNSLWNWRQKWRQWRQNRAHLAVHRYDDEHHGATYWQASTAAEQVLPSMIERQWCPYGTVGGAKSASQIKNSNELNSKLLIDLGDRPTLVRHLLANSSVGTTRLQRPPPIVPSSVNSKQQQITSGRSTSEDPNATSSSYGPLEEEEHEYQTIGDFRPLETMHSHHLRTTQAQAREQANASPNYYGNI